MNDLDKMSKHLMSDDTHEKQLDAAIALVVLFAIVGLAVWFGASMFGAVCVVIGLLALVVVGHALADIAQYFSGVAK